MGFFGKIKNILFEDEEEDDIGGMPVYTKDDVKVSNKKEFHDETEEIELPPIRANANTRFKNVKRDIDFDENDVQIELSKSGGAGGQHINKTESAVKLIHMPTGITAICQDERSQLKNKEKAFIALKEKVLKNFNKDNEKDIQIQRKQMFNAVFSGVSTFVLDFDKNRFIVCDTKNEYKLADVDDALQLIINDVKMLKR